MQEVISIGNKIDMEILIDGEPESDVRRRRVLYSRLMDIPEDNILRISMPYHEKRLVPLSMGEQYLLYIYADKGIYSGRFVVINRLKEGNIYLADIEAQDTLKKVQRREYYRYDCRLSAGYRVVPEKEQWKLDREKPEEQEWKKSVIIDISGGGVKMVSEYQEAADSLLQIRFQLISENVRQNFVVFGRLIASLPNRERSNLIEQRIAFEQIAEQDREQIIRYIFDEERKRLAKEKGSM